MSDFFNKLISNIDKGMQVVSSRGKEFIEVSRLRLEISTIKSAIKRKHNAVGQKTYEMFSKNEFNEEALKADCDEITNLYEKTAALQAAIKDLEMTTSKTPPEEDVIACPKCGAPNKTGDRFCKDCNAEIMEETVSEEKKCPSCGMPAKAESRFCPACGSKLDEPEAETRYGGGSENKSG